MVRLSGVFLSVVMTMAACAGKLPPPAGPADVQWAQSRWPAMAPSDLEAGRQVLLTKCAGCHRAPLPEEYSPAAWPHYLDEMAARAKLTATDRSVIEQYVLTLSRPPAAQ
jgi:mono/diheme cytochrome c family protein